MSRTDLPKMCEELLRAIEDLRRSLSPVAMSAGLEYMEDCAGKRDCYVAGRCSSRLRAVRSLEPVTPSDLADGTTGVALRQAPGQARARLRLVTSGVT